MNVSEKLITLSRWIGLGLALALLLSACGAEAPAATTGPIYTGPADGFVTVAGEGFQIDLPESFSADGTTQIAIGESVYSSLDGFTNVSINRLQDTSIEAETLASAADSVINEYEATEGYTFLRQETFTGVEFETLKLSVSADENVSGATEDIIVVQYLMKDGDTLWLITFGTTASSLASWEADFDASAKTFRIAD